MSESLPEGWRMVKFEDIGLRINEKVEPAETDLEIYVGLEHLDPESLRIRRWGSPSDVIGAKLRIHPGDIIFGKRRAYQRKLAIADFDGICSAHAMVLRANEEKVHKDFFPFFLQSDMFMDRAEEISVGSLSPTINWKTLKKQEFPLPPLEEQKRIAEVLWAVEKAIWKTEDAIGVAERYKKVLMKHLFTYGPTEMNKIDDINMKDTKIGLIPTEWKIQQMKELGVFSKGKGISKKDYKKEGVPIISYGEIYTKHDIIIRKFYTYINKDIAEQCTRITNGDVLFTGSGETAEEIGKTVAYLQDKIAYAAGDVIIFTPNKINSAFLSYYLNSFGGLKQKMRYAQGKSVVHIYAHHLEKIFIPVPPANIQKDIVNILEKQYDFVKRGLYELSSLTLLKSNLLNSLISGNLNLGGRHQ